MPRHEGRYAARGVGARVRRDADPTLGARGRVRAETKSEYADELAFDRGENDEGISFRTSGRLLTDELPAEMPYAIIFDEDCGGDTEFCRRILPPLTRVTKALAAVGEGGRFVPAPDAGHDIYESDPELVAKTVADVLAGSG